MTRLSEAVTNIATARRKHDGFNSGPLCAACRWARADHAHTLCFWCWAILRRIDAQAELPSGIREDMKQSGIPLHPSRARVRHGTEIW